MQFSIRSLLAVTTFLAVAIGCAPPRHRGPITAYYLYIGLTGLLAVSILLLDAAKKRAQSCRDQSAPARFNFEKLAIACAWFALIPFLAYWAMCLFEPYESKHGLAEQVTWILFFYVTLPTLPLAPLVLAASFYFFFGVRANVWLFALRLLWLLMCFAVPLYFFYFVLPNIG